MNDLRNTSDHDLVDSIYAKMSWNNADCEAMSRVCTIKIWFLETEYEKKTWKFTEKPKDSNENSSFDLDLFSEIDTLSSSLLTLNSQG